MQTVMVDIEKLIPDPNNERKHDQKNIDAIVGSLTKFNQVEPLICRRNNVLIGGHGRLEAMKKIGMKQVAVHYVDLKTETEAAALRVALNRTAELGTWDDELLGKTLQALREDDFGIEGIGFDPGDYWDEEKTEGLTDPDEVPEVPQNVRGVQRGQIWQLGDHRMMCGDSTSKEDVERLMGGEKADMVFTDPPYGMSFDPAMSARPMPKGNWVNEAKNYSKVIGDDVDFDPTTIFALFGYCKEIFLWGADYFAERIPDKNNGSWVVWDKREGLEDVAWSTSEFELCWSKQRHQRQIARIRWMGLAGTEKEFDKKRHHPTQKPIGLAEWFLDRWGKPSDLVVDLFLGSGSTLIACEKTGRKCRGLEIDPHYCSVIIERWEKFTGKKAELCK